MTYHIFQTITITNLIKEVIKIKNISEEEPIF